MLEWLMATHPLHTDLNPVLKPGFHHKSCFITFCLRIYDDYSDFPYFAEPKETSSKRTMENLVKTGPWYFWGVKASTNTAQCVPFS